MQRLLWTIAGLIAVLAVFDLVVMPPADDAAPAAAREPSRQFASRPDLAPPVLTTGHRRPGASAGLVFVAPKRKSGQSGPAILDADGEYVWFKPMPKGVLADDLRVQTYRGQPVLTWWEGKTNPRGYGKGTWVIADRSYREIARVRAANGLDGDLHDIELTDRGTAYITIYESVKMDLTPVNSYADGEAVDSVIQEIDIATGDVLWEWKSLDHVALGESYAGIPRKTRFPYDYFHINSIDVDSDGNLLVSARNTWAIYKIDRKTGDVIWRLGGYRSDFALGQDVRFAWQHDARRQPDGSLTLFDNEATPKVGPYSRALRLELDEDAMTATATQVLKHPDDVLAIAQGNTQVLDGGNVFVGFGSGRRVSELSAEGELLFDIEFPSGVDSYRAYRFAWEGRPDERPAVAATRSDGRLHVDASWNGATAALDWQVLAGDSPSSLRPVARAHKTGFETSIPVATDAAYVAVRALDGDRELATSAAVRVS